MVPINSPHAKLSVHPDEYAGDEYEGDECAGDDKTENTEKSGTSKSVAIHTAVIFITIASVIMQCLAMAIEQSTFLYCVGILALLLATVVGVRQVTMAKMDTLRDFQNKLREEVNELTVLNNELHNNVNDLETEVDRVQDLERKLSNIARADGTNVDHLVELVKANSIIIAKQSECIKGSVTEQVLTSVLRTDRNSDLKLNDREIDILVRRLRHQDGIKVEENQLRTVLQKGDGSIGNLMDFFRSIMDESTDDKGPITLDMPSLHTSFRK